METYRAESLGSYGAVHTWKAGVHNGLGERGTSRDRMDYHLHYLGITTVFNGYEFGAVDITE